MAGGMQQDVASMCSQPHGPSSFVAHAVRMLVVLVLCAGLSGCAAIGRGSVLMTAEVIEPVHAVLGTEHRWVVTVRLDRGDVAGATVVQVAFDEPELTCGGGTSFAPEDLESGQRLAFERVGDNADMMAPPIIAGRALVVSC